MTQATNVTSPGAARTSTARTKADPRSGRGREADRLPRDGIAVQDAVDAERREATRPCLRPAIVHVDVADTTVTCAGQVELNVTGDGLPAITKKRLEEVLSCDHDLRVVLSDGGRPLAVSDLVHAEDIPTKTRIAVKARDRGCRFGSPAPPGRTHVHHIDGREHGHHPDRLITLGAWPHLRGVHRHGWKPTPRPDATVTWRRGTRTFTTLPRGTPLRRIAPDHDTS